MANNEHRGKLLSDMSQALYEFTTTYSTSTWEGRRPGLGKPKVTFSWKSCGAFRAWRIHCASGVVAFSMDGFAYRDHKESGIVSIKLGSGHIVFPTDDSRSDHSLSLTTSDKNTRLVNVTDEAVPWEATIEAMTKELAEATHLLNEAVAEYDRAEAKQKEQRKTDDIQAACNALAQATKED